MNREIIKCEWSILTSYLMRRYPNPKRPDILSIEILERQLEGSKIHMKRLVTMDNFGIVIYGLEEIEIDSKVGVYKITSTNINYRNVIQFIEKCEYVKINDNETEIIRFFETNGNYLLRNTLSAYYWRNVKIGRDLILEI